MMRKSEREMHLNKYYVYLRENDEMIKEMYNDIHVLDETIKDTLSDENIEYLHKLQLTNHDIHQILNCGLGTVAGYVAKYNRNKRDEFIFEELDYTSVVEGSFKDSFDVPLLTYQEQLFLMISDTQAGAMITTEGIDKDPEGTINKYFDKLRDGLKAKIQDRKIRIGNFNLMFLGDLVEGWGIFKGQLSIPIRNQKRVMIENILKLITFISETFKPETINIYAVFGNHGRISPIHDRLDNWDVQLMDSVHDTIAMLKNYDPRFGNVNSYISERRVQIHEIGKWKYLMTHGDQRGLTVARNSISRKSSGWMRKYGWHDAVILGHWHQFQWFSLDGVHVVMGGCTYESPYVSDEIAGAEDIVQVLFGANEDSSVAWVELIDVELEK